MTLFKKCKAQQAGLAILGTVAVLLVVSVLGLALVAILAVGQALLPVEVGKEKARMIAMAGLEYGLLEKTAVTQLFGGGQFVTAITPGSASTSARLSATGTYSDYRAAYSSDIRQQACLLVDMLYASFTSNKKTLQQVLISEKSSCVAVYPTLTVDSMIMTWPATKTNLKTITLDTSTVVYAGTYPGGGSGVDLTPTVAVGTATRRLDFTWDKAPGTPVTVTVVLGDGSTVSARYP